MIIVIISFIIGMAVVDSLTTTITNVLGVTDEQENLSSVPTTITLGNTPFVIASLSFENVTGTSLTSGTTINYTVLDRTAGTINVTGYNSTLYGQLVNVTYNYEPTGYLQSSLSRTIAIYIVPIGLLALLGLVAMGLMKS